MLNTLELELLFAAPLSASTLLAEQQSAKTKLQNLHSGNSD